MEFKVLSLLLQPQNTITLCGVIFREAFSVLLNFENEPLLFLFLKGPGGGLVFLMSVMRQFFSRPCTIDTGEKFGALSGEDGVGTAILPNLALFRVIW